MPIDCVEKDTEIIIAISEKLNFHMHPDFNDYMDIVAQKQKNVIIDLSALNIIDSAGLGMLFLARKITKAAGKNLVLRNPRGQVKRIFDLTNIDREIKVVQG